MASDDEPVKPPPGWGDSELTRYLSMAAHNRHATFHNCKDHVEKLTVLDELFRTLDGWVDPPDRLTPLLAIRSHAAFRATVEHAMAGQLGDLFPAGRMALENAAYAVMLHRDAAKAEIWLRRHDDDESKKRSRRTFSHEAVLSAVKAQDTHIAKFFSELYDETIDFGGHPNERGLSLNARIYKDREGQTKIEQTMLHGGGPRLEFGLLAAREVGMCALAMLHIIAPERLGADGEDLQAIVPAVLAARAKRSGRT